MTPPKLYSTRGIYRVRSNDGSYYSIGIPREYGEQLKGLEFKFTMTDDGLLYLPMPADGDTTIELPAWAKEKP